MIGLFKNLVDKEFKKILWGKVKFNFDNILEKIYSGNQGNLESNIIVKDKSLFKDLVLRGDLGFAEGYIENKWETSNLNSLLKILLKNQQLKKNRYTPTLFNKILEQVNFIFKSNSIKQAKKNISFHYDLGNDFYKEWLDETMTYSSALFKGKDITLKDAQIQKYNSICENLNINDDDKICEIGCGWGGFINNLKNYNQNTKIDGYTISKNQYDFVSKNNHKVFFTDYREINNKYSNAVSIEMFEAVGQRYWEKYFEKLNNILNSKGTACLQIITINENSFSKYLRNVDFIQKYIFPGGMLPTKTILTKLFKSNGFKLYHKISFGHDYSKTLLEWKKNFNNSWIKLKNLGFDDKFNRLWNYYLDYCETGFSLDHTDVTQFYIKKIN
jgi:cyclopropane-fatty-acyl-phospholipid synthase